MIRFLLGFGLMFAPHAQARGYVIGNGGHAYEINGSVFLTDLLEAGVQSSPLDLPNAAMPEILEQLKKIDIAFPYPRESLARKLTELDVRAPGIAQNLLLAMGFFRWRLIEVPIGSVNDHEGNTLGLPESSRVQAAVRLSDIIRVQSQVWNRLDDLNKIALLVHEAIFSLIKTEPYEADNRAGLFFQSSRKTRELVGLAFGADRNNHFQALARGYLSIPAEDTGASFNKIPVWTLDMSDGKGGMTFLRSFQFALSSWLDKPDIDGFIADICRMPSKKQFPSLGYLVLSGGIDRALPVRKPFSYPSPFGFQYAVSIGMLSEKASSKTTYILFDEATCKKGVSAYIEIFKAAGILTSTD